MRYSRLCYFVWSLFLASLGSVFAEKATDSVVNDKIEKKSNENQDTESLMPEGESMHFGKKNVHVPLSIDEIKGRFEAKLKKRKGNKNGEVISKSWEEVEVLLYTAMELKRKNRFKEAMEMGREGIVLLKASLDEEGLNPVELSEVYAQMGKIYEYVLKDFSQAAESYQLALELNPQQARSGQRLSSLKHYLK